MSALALSSAVGASVSNGTQLFTGVAVVGADGSLFHPAMASPATTGFVRLNDGTNSVTLVNSANLPVAAQAVPTGGATPYSLIVVGTTQDSTNVKASAGTLYAINVQSVVAGVRYLKLYDKATPPLVGDTSLLKLRVVIPGSTTGVNVSVPLPPCGVAFASGIGFRVTTGEADSDATGATASDNIINLVYG